MFDRFRRECWLAFRDCGSFHFSQILGQGAGAILRGVPLKIVMVFDTRPLNWLFARKEIKSLQDLKGGKQIAVSSFGAALDQMTGDCCLNAASIRKKMWSCVLSSRRRPIRRVDERRRRRLGGQPDGPHHREEERFHRVALLRRHLEFVTAGAVTTEKLLAQRPDFVQRFLRGTLKGFHWLKTNEKDVVARMIPIMKVSESEATDIYRAWPGVMSVDGTIPRSLQEKMIAFQRKSLKVDREVLPENL